MKDSNNRIEAFALTDRAIRLQLADDAELSEVERCLSKALELDPENIDALQEAAHLYDAVIPDRDRARKYASLCRENALRVVAEMDNILSDNQ